MPQERFLEIGPIIRNDLQYRMVGARAQRLRNGLAVVGEEGTRASQLKSQLNRLDPLIERYQDLQARRIPPPNLTYINLRKMEDYPRRMIERRIWLGLTQKQLAETLGLREQQIQRYEAEDYKTASFRRMKEVKEALHPYEPGQELEDALVFFDYPAPITAEVVVWQKEGAFADWKEDGWNKNPDLNTAAWCTGAEEWIGYQRYLGSEYLLRLSPLYGNRTDQQLDDFADSVTLLMPLTSAVKKELGSTISRLSLVGNFAGEKHILGSPNMWEGHLKRSFYREGFTPDKSFPDRCFWYGALLLAKEFPSFRNQLKKEVITAKEQTAK